MIWVPHRAVSELLFTNDDRGVMEAFRNAKISVPGPLKLAEDAFGPAQDVMQRHA